MSQAVMVFRFIVLIVGIVLGGPGVASEQARNWLVLDSTENGRPEIVRTLSAMPSPQDRAIRPWRLTVEWHYQKNGQGLPTEASIQKAQEIEDGLYSAMQEVGEVDLPVVKTGNGIRTWIYYVSDAAKVVKPIRKFLRRQPELTVRVKTEEDVDWLALKEILENVHR